MCFYGNTCIKSRKWVTMYLSDKYIVFAFFTIFLLDVWIVNSLWYYILLFIWSQLFNPLLTFAVKSAIPYYFNENYFIAIKQITKKHFYINYLSVSYFTTDKLFWISIIINLNDLSHAPTSKWNIVIWSVR